MKNRFRLYRAAAAGVLAMAMLPMTGCQKEEAEVNPDALNIAVIIKNMNSTYWNSVWTACDDLESEFGDEINILRMGPNEETAEAQIKEIEKAISQDVNAIVLAACDPEAENDVLATATAAGIPIITIDSDVSYEGRTCYLGTMNDNAAEAAARYTATLMGNEGKIGIIYHGDGATTATDRRDAFISSLGGNFDATQGMPAGAGSKPNNAEGSAAEAGDTDSNIEVADVLNGNNDWEESKEQAKKLILEDQVDVIFGTNSKGTWGACVAIEELLDTGEISPGQVKVVGFDFFNNEGKSAGTYLENGTLSTAVVQNPYNMGYMGVQYALDVIKGTPVPSVVDTGVTLVTVDNLHDNDVQFLIGNNTAKK